MSIKKGDKLIYRNRYGDLYTALVLRAHKDESWTIKVLFPLKADGVTEEDWGYLGFLYRIDRSQIAATSWRRA